MAPPLPWFVFGFIALIGVNSLGLVPAEAKAVLVPLTSFLLTVALIVLLAAVPQLRPAWPGPKGMEPVASSR